MKRAVRGEPAARLRSNWFIGEGLEPVQRIQEERQTVSAEHKAGHCRRNLGHQVAAVRHGGLSFFDLGRGVSSRDETYVEEA